MTIEQNLESIASSLAVIAEYIININEPVVEPVKVDLSEKKITVADVRTVQEVKGVGAQQAKQMLENGQVELPEESIPEPTVTEVTPDELNQFLVSEVGRLGGREKIDDLLRDKFNAQGISGLDTSKYSELMQAVKELK